MQRALLPDYDPSHDVWFKPVCLPETIYQMLAHVDATYDGTERYLTTSGLISTGFVDMVRDQLARNDVPAASMIIEIDERELLRNTRMLGEILRELSTVGVRIAVDGFGAATVSLGWLRDSPINVLKLAGSLVQHFDATPTDRAIAASLVQLAHHLDLHVVAQSVERSETLAIARELGCDSYQGVLFAPPLAPQEVEVLLRWQQSDGPVRTVERR